MQFKPHAAFTFPDVVPATAVVSVLSVAVPAGCAHTDTKTLLRHAAVATSSYTLDNNDVMPLANVLKPGDNGSGIATLTAYPYSYNDHPVLPGAPNLWNSAPRQNMAACMVHNALQIAYGLNLNLPLPHYDKLWSDDSFQGPGLPLNSGASFNGDLHRYPVSAVANPAVCIEWWCGFGNDGPFGRTFTQPQLNCGEMTGPDTCLFKAGESPNQGAAFFETPETQGEDILPPNTDYWINPSHSEWFVRVDGSAKFLPMGKTVFPNKISLSGRGPWSDPFYSVSAGNGVPNGDTSGGFPMGMTMCSGPQTPVPYGAPDPSGYGYNGVDLTGAYSCYFRPDRPF